MTKNLKNLQLKKIKYFFLLKTSIYLNLNHKGRPSYKRSRQLSKKNIQHLKTRNFSNFFYFCGSFLPFWIRIRIPNTDPDHSGSNWDPDPDPQHWFEQSKERVGEALLYEAILTVAQLTSLHSLLPTALQHIRHHSLHSLLALRLFSYPEPVFKTKKCGESTQWVDSF